LRYILVICITLFTQSLLAQSTDTDSLEQVVNNRLDSLEESTPTDTLQQVTNAIQHEADSLEQLGRLTQVDSITEATQNKIDSLSALNLPTDKYENKLDSLANHYPNQVKEKLTELKEKGKNKLNKAKASIEEKLNPEDSKLNKVKEKLPDEKLSDIEGKMPDTDIEDKIPVKNTEIEGIDNPLADEQIENPLDDVSNPVSEEVSTYSDKASEITNKPTEEVTNAKDKVGLDKVTEEAGKVKEYTDQAGEVSEDVSQAKAGDWTGVEEKAEEELVKQADINELGGDANAFDETKGAMEEKLEIGKKYQDPELVKQRILEKSKHVSNDLLKQYKDKVAAAQANVFDQKPDSIHFNDPLQNYQPNALPSKKFKDRVLPGFTVEVVRQSTTSIDVSSFVGYRFNTKANVWLGYMYRVRISEDKILNQHATVYGPRLSFNYDVYKGFYLRATGERLRANVPSQSADAFNREWVNALLVGIGKDYQVGSIIRGDVHAMYNVIYKQDKTPYPKKFNIRFGFYFNALKKHKPSWKDKLKRIENKYR